MSLLLDFWCQKKDFFRELLQKMEGELSSVLCTAIKLFDWRVLQLQWIRYRMLSFFWKKNKWNCLWNLMKASKIIISQQFFCYWRTLGVNRLLGTAFITWVTLSIATSVNFFWHQFFIGVRKEAQLLWLFVLFGRP